jgi:hypothetical protein
MLVDCGERGAFLLGVRGHAAGVAQRLPEEVQVDAEQPGGFLAAHRVRDAGIGTATPSQSAFTVTGVPIDHHGILGHSMPDCAPPASPTASNDVTRPTGSSKWSCYERML